MSTATQPTTQRSGMRGLQGKNVLVTGGTSGISAGPPPHTARRCGAAPRAEIAIDALHHTVYAVATGLAYELIAAGRRNGVAAP